MGNTNLSNSQIKKLKTFNDKANKLINSSFYKECPKISLDLTFNKIANTEKFYLEHGVKLVNQEFVDAFVLTFRMFIQKNDPIALDNFVDFFNGLPVDNTYKITLGNIKSAIDKYLNENALTFLSEPITNRELMDINIYGDLSHINAKKREKLSKWVSDELDKDVNQFRFQQILSACCDDIADIKRLNQEVLSVYSSN